MPRKQKSKKWLFGVGLDNKDGHKRLTKGPDFLLIGGSKETHEEMREKTIKIQEELKKIHCTLDTVNQKQMEQIAHKLKLTPINKKS